MTAGGVHAFSVTWLPSPFGVVCDRRRLLPHGHGRDLGVMGRRMGLEVGGGRRIVRGAAPGIRVHIHFDRTSARGVRNVRLGGVVATSSE